jgi:tetratricopeptide (TPR) repeat protein
MRVLMNEQQQSEKKYDVFLSHAHGDAEAVETLAGRLADEAGFEVFLDKWVLVPGETWQPALAKGLDQAASCAVFIGNKAHAGWFKQEVQRALNRQASEPTFRVIPVILPGGDPALVNDFLELRTWVQFKDGLGDKEAFHRLVSGIKGVAPGRWGGRENKDEAIFVVPTGRNPVFTGREEELAGLEKALAKSGVGALTGLGGMGKTQTAAEYCYRHRDEYRAVLWVTAESTVAVALASGLVKLAGPLGLKEAGEQDERVVAEAVRTWLSGNDGWLVVLDNVEEQKTIAELVKQVDGGRRRHVIVTTQLQATGKVAKQKIEGLDSDPGALLLLRRAGLVAADAGLEAASMSEVKWARNISEEVGGLALALDQAGAYIEETQSGLEDYYKLLQKRRAEVLKRRGGDSDHVSVEATYTTALDKLGKLENVGTAAVDLVKVMGFLPAEGVPEEIFREGAAEFDGALAEAAGDELKWNEAMGAAGKFSLVKRQAEEKLLSVHRMVQAVVKEGMSEEERKRRAEQVVRAVEAVFPGPEFQNWATCERLVGSALACAGLVEEYRLEFEGAGRLLNVAGYYLKQRARYAGAEPLYRRALAIDEKAYGPDHSEVATDLNNLAELLRQTNRLQEAEPLHRRALAISEKALGPEHPDVAIRLNNLAELLTDTNRLEEAEPLYRRALEIWEKAYGPEHPLVASGLNNLAELLRQTSRLQEAEPLYRRALAIDEKVYGLDHPDVAIDLNNLGLLLKQTNRLPEAEPMYRRALAIREKALGPEHPDVAQSLNNLGLLLTETNRLKEAEPMFRRALAIFEKSLGPEHPRTVTVRKNLEELERRVKGIS